MIPWVYLIYLPSGIPQMDLALLERGFVRNGQLFSAFSSSRSQDPATIGGGHAFTETMFVFAFLAGRLERAFHISALSCFYLKGVQKCLSFLDFTTFYQVFSPRIESIYWLYK
jgi:hypothetical protein